MQFVMLFADLVMQFADLLIGHNKWSMQYIISGRADPFASDSHKDPLLAEEDLNKKGKLKQRMINEQSLSSRTKVYAMLDCVLPTERERQRTGGYVSTLHLSNYVDILSWGSLLCIKDVGSTVYIYRKIRERTAFGMNSPYREL